MCYGLGCKWNKDNKTKCSRSQGCILDEDPLSELENLGEITIEDFLKAIALNGPEVYQYVNKLTDALIRMNRPLKGV